MEVNLATMSNDVMEKIHEVLRPFEYTRIDRIVELVFTTAEDRSDQIEEPASESFSEEQHDYAMVRTDRDTVETVKQAIVSRLSAKLKIQLRRVRHSLYSNSEDSVRAVLAVSKKYEGKSFDYWYAYHDSPQRTFLSASQNGYMVFGCVDSGDAYAVPYELLETAIENLYVTVKKDGRNYKHVYLSLTPDGAHLTLRDGNYLDISGHKINGHLA
jgi:hypothetical protein